jgi:hypothetical protein
MGVVSDNDRKETDVASVCQAQRWWIVSGQDQNVEKYRKDELFRHIEPVVVSRSRCLEALLHMKTI